MADLESLPVDSSYDFGPYRLDVSRRAVTRQGQPLALPPKTFELLLLLVRSDGRALSRHELLTALWPDTFVEEANLSFQISTLRRALGDGAGCVIETIPKHGYRLAVEVQPLGAGTVPRQWHERDARPPEPQTPIDGRVVARARAWRRPSAGLALLGLMAVAYAAALQLRARPQPTDLGAAATPLTAYHGAETAPSLSPDGTQVAFASNRAAEGNFDIYVLVVGGGEPLRLTSHPAPDVSPVWSPDGRRLSFLRQSAPEVFDLFVMPALGGTERRVATLDIPLTFGHPGAAFQSWTPDGTWVVLGGALEGQPGLWLVEADGDRRRRLTVTAGAGTDRSPVVSADGTRIAFIRQSGLGRESLFVLRVDADLAPSGPPIEIVDPAPWHVIAAAWGPADESLVYSEGSYMGTSRLRRVGLAPGAPAAAGAPEPLPFGEQATGLDIAASGRLVYASRFRDSGFLRLDPTEPGRGMRDAQVSATTYDEHTPHYSPDGSRLAFASTRSGTEEIWIANADGSSPRQMTHMGGPMCANPQWSPDGRRIVFSSSKSGSVDLYRLDPSTAEIARLTSAAGGEDLPRWSRDGRWIYFAAAGADGARTEIWKLPADRGTASQVTTGGGEMAEESHDGRHLYFTRPSPRLHTLWRMPTGGGHAVQVADGVIGSLNFVVGRRAVYLVARADRPSASWIEAVDIATDQRTRLARYGRRW